MNLGIGGLASALVTVALAYFIVGYTAGRMARFDAVKNGIGVVIWTIVVGIILGIAVLGTRFHVASQLHLTIDAATLTIAGVISLAIPLIVMMGVAACRGRAGQEAGGQSVEG